MRKSIGLVVAIMLTTTLYVHGQEKKFGVIGGLNVSNIRGDRAELSNNDWRLAYHIGVFSNLPLSDKIAFEPRVEFSSIGYVDEVDFGLFGDLSPTATVFEQRIVNFAERNSYLSVPLLCKYKLTNKVSLDLGPEVAFLLYSKDVITKVDGEGPFEKGDVPAEGSGDFFVDYGAMAGVTFYITNNASIQLNYYHGLSNILRTNQLIDITENNSVFQLAFGYLIL